MLNRIIEFSVRNKLIIGLFLVALIAYGTYQFRRLPIDAVPDITNNQVQVITVAPSLGATDIERLVTFPIELANSNIPGLIEIRSFSRFGLSLVTIVFEDDVDVYWARQQVAERLNQVKSEIPEGIGSISLAPVTTGLGEIYQYTVRAKKGYEKKYDATALRTIQDWIVRRQLLGVKGVADVSSFGGNLKQYEIAVDPAKLKSFELTINDVFDALSKNNQNTGGAYIEKGPTVQFIRSEGLVGTIEDIENIFIKETGKKTPVLIRDVATVKYGHATRYGAMCYNDQGEVAGAVVMMLKGENSNVVIKNIKDRIAQIQKTLPEGVIVEPFLDRTKMVNNAIGTVETNLMEGAIIVLFILILFLGNLRAGFIVASVIPLAMLFAIIMMNLFGVSGNLMSLGALDFGLIVDGAVIIVEALLHQLSHNKKFANIHQLNQQQMDSEVVQSSSRMMNSAVFGQIIILVVYLPIFMLEGIEGKMFKPMVQTVSFALLGAFILSLTYVPMISSLLLSKKISHKKTLSDRIMEFIERKYQSYLYRVLSVPKTVLAFIIGLFALAVVVLSGLGGEFIPELEEGDFAVETRVLTGSNLKTSIASTQKAVRILKSKFPEVEQIVTKIGSGEIPTDPMPMEAADMMVILKDKKEWTSATSFDELAEKMTEAVSVVPGITVSFQFPVQMRFNELMTGAKQDVVCKIFGENLDTLAKYAHILGEISKSVEGTTETFVEPIGGLAQIVINYKRKAIAQYGISINAINQTINAGLAGQSSGFVYEGEKRFDMVVRVEQNKRNNIDDIKNLLIATDKGVQIPLYLVADVELKEGPNQIQREDAKRRITVGFNVRGRDVQSIVEEIQNKVNKKLKLPSGYYITYGGAFENLNAAKARLSITVPIALLLIFLLLYFSFGSIKQGLLIYSAIPLSAMGGIFALFARDMPFSISAGIGFIALFGVAVLNGIVLIAEFNRLKKEGWKNTFKIVVMGTKIRLRPVLMTAFVASLGFLPMAISNGAGAEVQRPLATVVIGGLLIATFLTLFVLPILYVLFEKGYKKPLKSIPVILIGFFIASSANAQQSLSLNSAIDSCFKNNHLLIASEIRIAEAKALEKGSLNISNTSLGIEYGHVNSAATDNKLSVSQSLQFPTVYQRQKSLYEAVTALEKNKHELNRLELKSRVISSYYDVLILEEKKKLLLQADSVFKNFIEKEELKVKLGENNALHYTSASLQRMSIQNQLNSLQTDLEQSLLLFNYLIQTKKSYSPEKATLKQSLKLMQDTSILENTAYVLTFKQEQYVAQNEWRLAKSMLLPQFSFGYINQTFVGWQMVNNNDVFYDNSNRFSSVQFSIDVPLFARATRSKSKYASLVYEEKQIEYQQAKREQWFKLKQTEQAIFRQQEIINAYEKTGLPEVEKLKSNALLLMNKGAIDYSEWMMLMNQTIAVQTDYLEAISKLNEYILNYHQITNAF